MDNTYKKEIEELAKDMLLIDPKYIAEDALKDKERYKIILTSFREVIDEILDSKMGLHRDNLMTIARSYKEVLDIIEFNLRIRDESTGVIKQGG